MIKNKKATILLIVLVTILLIFPIHSNAEIDKSKYNYYYNDYVIDKYGINMVVNEDNTFDITETITAYFYVPKHGIYRKIPFKNNVTRADGTKSNNTAQISNIIISENYTTSNQNGNRVIKIGDKNKTVLGRHTYTIKYTYNIGKDPLDNIDELYFNLIGNEWDTTISNVSFNIIMPKSFDKSLLGFSSGYKNSIDSSNIQYNVNENNITGTVKETLLPGQAVTVRLELPEGYFVGAGLKIDKFSIFVIVFCFVCILLSCILWSKYGKDEKVVETVEFYPPKGYNSAEVAFFYKGNVTKKDIISLLIYLASKGYLKIEETEPKNSFSISKGFKITKLKEYDGNNEYEKIFFNGLFKDSNTENLKVKDEIKVSKNIETKEYRETVTDIDLNNHFYKVLNEIESKMNSKENRKKIFKTKADNKIKWLILMSIVIFVLITLKPILEFSEKEILFFALVFPGIGFGVIIGSLIGKLEIPKLFAILWGGTFGGIPWYFIILPCLLQNIFYLITYIIGIISIVILLLFTIIMDSRTTYGNEMLGKIKGFKRFLEIAEKPQLEKLVMENPEYFYDILPYTYVLGISDKWISKFETIAIEPPNWYDSNSIDSFNANNFGTLFNATMSSVSTSMSSAPSSSSGGSSFSGGGSSGGGSGGGGGGSW